MAQDQSDDAASGHSESTIALATAAIGVVYGDIGTSPLYAIRESINHYDIGPVIKGDVLGILSLVFWSLLLVISVKYLVLVLQADNDGEGGIIALTALINPLDDQAERGSWRWVAMLLGLFGAALLWGDSMITPAISVVSAVEGLEVVTPVFKPYIIPITIGILIGLFIFQTRGTAGVGKVFGPITSVWFLFLGGIGVVQIVGHPSVLQAVNPVYAAQFFVSNGVAGFLVLGSIFLVVTGGEALYADIGHFGTFPIRLTWFGFVLPALLLNYFGQGALILENLNNAAVLEQPFFHMTNFLPHWVLYVQVALATAATIIASQAVISGAFSLTSQAVQLGYLPRFDIEHTSEAREGQIFMPAVNWTLMVACIGLVVGFSPDLIGGTKTSSNLAAAYGVAVTTDMVFTTVLFVIVARLRWQWSIPVLGVLTVAILSIDMSFWIAMLPKIPEGGWFPLVVAAGFFTVMTTWKRGRQILSGRLDEKLVPYEAFFDKVDQIDPVRVEGTAVYMSSRPNRTPHAAVHNLAHNRVLHERVIFLTVETMNRPYVDPSDRTEVTDLGDNCYNVIAQYGFAEDPNISLLTSRLELGGQRIDKEQTTYFLGREILRATDEPGMAIWREKLFSTMSRNELNASEHFHLPAERVVEVGVRVPL